MRQFYTIEPDEHGVIVYEWGVYERSSVLAGQQRKTFMSGYGNVAEALKAYPKADVMGGRISPPPVSVMHLPDTDY